MNTVKSQETRSFFFIDFGLKEQRRYVVKLCMYKIICYYYYCLVVNNCMRYTIYTGSAASEAKIS